MPNRINLSDTISIVIDVQERLFPLIYENEKLEHNLVRLIKGLKALNVQLIVTQQYTKGLGGTIQPVSEVLGEFTHLEKTSFSCCGDETIMSSVKNSGKKYVVLMGIESHVCVFQTALDLLDNGFIPVLIEDCVSSRNPNDKKIAVSRIRNAGGIISTYESILFELTVVSDTEQFKSISKIVK